ncbi:GAF domain-containing protein [Streptomyces zingiberis]|uniref:GAF domain-containing protein n=1 Tax=Streptomyces zingiberis TaxID=2053010 RepID=A0ABX1BQW1_9ACTN|nr:GAF domain-containing protein [Streptomyces zingiberis]NJQ00107.1 GAF domain-containing protein [Streptomyces zingiberis]
MVNPWVALEPGADPAERAGAIRRAHDAFTADPAGRDTSGSGHTTARGAAPHAPSVRPVVADSWRRSARARVSPDGTAPVELPGDELDTYRAEHPLSRVMPLFRDLMGTVAVDGEHLLAVCDARGRLLWVEGHSAARRRADGMNFVPGAAWGESAVGTNAPGTAVALDRPVQVFAAEHFTRTVHTWTCAAAPVHDPHSGRLLGAVDITGGDRLAHPHSLALVQAVARAAESQLALEAPLPVPSPDAELSALGTDEAVLTRDGRALRLSRRHSELLLLLARHPEGLTGDELLVALYEDEHTTPVTPRAELSRLRRILGDGLLRSRPYRLTAPVATDVDTILRHLAAGAPAAALAAYRGPLLPSSQAPAVRRLRRRVHGQLREGLFARRDPELLSAWTASPWGAEDLEAWTALASALPHGSPRQAPVLERVRALDAEHGGHRLP